jgi:anti-sigma factor RsiW
MTCERMRTLLPGYLDGELPAAEQFAVQAHMDGCAGCAGECEAQRRLIRLLADAPRRTLGPEWDAALKARIVSLERTGDGRSGERVAWLRPDWRLLIAPAAAAALLLGVWRPVPTTVTRASLPPSERAYVSKLVGQHVAGTRIQELPEQEAVDVALRSTSLVSLIE